MSFRALRQFLGFTGAILALVGLFVFASSFAGCKDKSTSAAPPEKHVGAPPLVRATSVSAAGWNGGQSDPLDDAVWAKANWYLLQSPMNTSRTTPPARAAMVYDADAFYVAFVSDTVPPPASPIARDVVSVFLDTSKAGGGNGTETVQIAVDDAGQCRCTWIRASTPAVAKEDGSPETSHPLNRIPDYAVKGLTATVRRTTLNGTPVWTTVVTIPFKTLPIPLRVSTTTVGERWKVNLLRNITTADAGSGTQQLQANLSPVYLNAQAVSPYRMAVLELSK